DAQLALVIGRLAVRRTEVSQLRFMGCTPAAVFFEKLSPRHQPKIIEDKESITLKASITGRKRECPIECFDSLASTPERRQLVRDHRVDQRKLGMQFFQPLVGFQRKDELVLF